MLVRPAHMDDAPAIWRITGPTIRADETYALDRDMSEADALAYWLGNDRKTFVAEGNGEIIGRYCDPLGFGFDIVGRIRQPFHHPNSGM